ncbi:macrophage colony-stimulating factor 1 receptor 1 [Colossoma macropomum]|uniref:macrophage colony-stimulating factor 1 receptor 1 n=1 Tax=Colossoma macropomum TaxID=42526 RepID=UPI001864C4A4|nr:macrophage colony-stimulating factor 1 receptor 1 [Colossoma macropomum]
MCSPCFSPHSLDLPEIRLNSSALKKTEVVLLPGTSFSLSCQGQAKVFWRTRVSNRIRSSKNVLTVKNSTADHTGTYRCSYENQTELFSELHIFVKDPAKFFTKSLKKVIIEREGSSCLLDCRPTDPTATALSLRSADGSPVHPELNYTADPRQGILIHDLQLSYSGEYVCSIRVNETERLSTVYSITVQERLRPPSVFIDMDEYVRIAGETLQISCYTTNQNHAYVVTWHNSAIKMLHVKDIVSSSQDLVHIKSILTLPEVSVSDTGNLTCTGRSRHGENSSTVSLTVVDKPYIHLTPVLKLRGRQFGADAKVMEGELLELSVEIDAHPPIQEKWWSTPRTQNSSIYEENFYRIERSYRNVTSLLLRGIRADESGQYIFSARSSSVNVSTHFKIHVYHKPSVVVKEKNGILTCISSGFPKPTIRWQHCEKFQSTCGQCNSNHSVDLLAKQLTLEPMDEFRPVVESGLSKSNITGKTVECVAVNSVGESCETYFTAELYFLSSTSEDWGSKMFTTLLSGGSVITALLLVLLGISVYKCKQKPRYEIRWKIIEANDGNNYTYIDPTQLPYNNTRWEFPRDRLTFGQVLGAGAFGKVVEAAAYGLDKDEHVTRVAVKMLKSSAHSEEKEALMCELKILSHLGQHANIVNLLGACTQGGPVLLITEYCSHGDLLNFLRRRAELFFSAMLQEPGPPNIYKNLSDHQSQIGRHSVNSYQDMSGVKDCLQNSCGGGEMDLDDLVRFSTQVAQGLEFLASKNCIHRDVAARNVLVTDCFVAKICDFGLARDIMNDSNYVVRGNARLPVKWMSPESIFECIYTVQSDVWSYGILLWEIFSLGRSPYPDVVVDARFYKMIKAGYHMAQPDFAPPEMYTIMKMCWSLEPTLRPTFGKIIQLIAKLLPESSDQQYENVQQELQQKLPSVQHVSLKACEDPSDRTTSQEEEQQPLMQLNNYQLC